MSDREPDAEALDSMGPVDYLVIEFPGSRMTGEAFPLLVDLVDRGIVRILDFVFIMKEDDGGVIEPGSSAAVLVYENVWAAPLAVALRREGAQLAASGRIPVQALLSALDATEPTAAGA
jgi:hypothetical protein